MNKMFDIYKPNRRMYNLFVKDFDEMENKVEWVNTNWGTIEDCLDIVKKFNYTDDMYVILPTSYSTPSSTFN